MWSCVQWCLCCKLRKGSLRSWVLRLRGQRCGPVRSDPGRFQRRTAAVFAQMAIEPERGLQPAAGWREPKHGHDDLLTKQIAGRSGHHQSGQGSDRTRVVYGKRVQVRVVLGGCGIIKKKNNNTIIHK